MESLLYTIAVYGNITNRVVFNLVFVVIVIRLKIINIKKLIIMAIV